MTNIGLIRRALTGSVITALLVAVWGTGAAHAKLVSTSPKADETVSSPSLIQVRFNEAIAVKLSSLKLAASDGSAVAIMSMNDAKDPATLSIMPDAKLNPGLYKVTWNVVADDGHKEQGTFSFTVR